MHLPDSSLLLTVGGASGCRLCARDSGETADSRQGVAGIRILAESRRACAAAKGESGGTASVCESMAQAGLAAF